MRFSQSFAIPCLLFRSIADLDLSTSFDPGLLASFYIGAFAGFAAARGDLSFFGVVAAATLGSVRDDVDPNGINGRNGGAGYVFSRVSDGISASLSARPFKPWQITFSWTQANGSERSDVILPIFYNDEFNTTTVGGQQVVAIRNAGNNSLTPLLELQAADVHQR